MSELGKLDRRACRLSWDGGVERIVCSCEEYQ